MTRSSLTVNMKVGSSVVVGDILIYVKGTRGRYAQLTLKVPKETKIGTISKPKGTEPQNKGEENGFSKT